MALELGLKALQALYHLAKTIKEAKENVEYIGERVHVTESLEQMLTLQLSDLDGKPKEANMEAIHEAVKVRVVKLQRATRRLKLKYQPLIKILEKLGGASTLVKDMTGKLSKALQSAVMALGSLSVLMRKRNDREEERNQRTFALKMSHVEEAEEEGQEGGEAAEADSNCADFKALFKRQCDEIAQVNAALNSLDSLVTALRSQDEALLSAMHDDEKGSHEKHKQGYALLPTYTHPAKKAQSFDDHDSPSRDKPAAAVSSLDELLHVGAQLLLDQAFCSSETAGPEGAEAEAVAAAEAAASSVAQVVDDHKLEKAMGRAFSHSSLAFLKRQLGVPQGDGNPKKVILRERMETLLLNESKGNVGLEIALVCSSTLVALDRQLDEAAALLPDVPPPLSHTRHITDTIIRPLITHALAVGLLLLVEKLREAAADDPDEAAVREGEADDKTLESSLVLLETFATDFAEAIDYNLAPDASLLVSIAIDAGDSKSGLGHTTRRRLELLMAILSICNVDSDKALLETIEADLRAEVALLSTATSMLTKRHHDSHLDSHQASLDAHQATLDAHQTLVARDLEVGVGLADKIHQLYADMVARDCYRRFGTAAAGQDEFGKAVAAVPPSPPEGFRRRSVFGK